MRRLAPLILALGLTLGLAGCGQKGPLYLPGDAAAAERYDPTGQQASDEDAPRQDDDTARDDES